MTKKANSTRGNSARSHGSTLTQRDADKFSRDAKKYTDAATRSKKAAQKTLVSLGIHTPTGKLSKRYG